jgi:hypothetical protein
MGNSSIFAPLLTLLVLSLGMDGNSDSNKESVMCNKKESSGYAKSIHYWKTLRGVKSFVEKQIANGGILSMEVDCYSEREKYIEGYIFVNGKFELQK